VKVHQGNPALAPCNIVLRGARAWMKISELTKTLETDSMKRALTLTALASACSASMAQSVPNNVTMYGVLDAGVQSVSGYAGGTNTSLVSGVMDGSRWGLRGSEDLGGGYRALFTLESRLEINNGSGSNRPPSGLQAPDRLSQAALLGLPGALQPAVDGVVRNLATGGLGVNLPNRFWDRQAYIGLVTPFGALLAGRQYTPGYEVSAAFDTMQTQSSLAAGQVAAFPGATEIRVSNALQYRIQLAGVTAGAMYGFSETAGNSAANRFYGGMGQYKGGMFSVGVGYNQNYNELGQKSLETVVLGATVNVGPGTLSGQYTTFKDDNPRNLSTIAASLTPAVGAAAATLVQNAFINGFKQDGVLAHIGYRMTAGANTFYIAYSQFDDKTSSNADTASYGVAYTYSLSKRTDLNAALTHFDNSGLGQAAPGQAGFVGGVTRSAGTDADSIAVGVRHRF
jgi:predicted porin